jgi:hypothetical protein
MKQIKISTKVKEAFHHQLRGCPCQKTISTQKLNLLGEVPRIVLYYSLTHPSSENPLDLKLTQTQTTLCLILLIRMKMVRFELATVWSSRL